jgi:hypothetical protein
MKTVPVMLLVLLFALFSGCATFQDGTKLPNKDGLDFKELSAALERGEIVELPNVLQRTPQTNDDRVLSAFREEYEIASTTESATQYRLKEETQNPENRQVLIDYLNTKIKAYSLDTIIGFYGQPAFYEFQRNKKRLTIHYIYEYTSMLFVLSPFWMPGWKTYCYYQFVFDLSSEDTYSSPLIFCKEDKFTGKYYGNKQPPLGEFLEGLVVSKPDPVSGE